MFEVNIFFKTEFTKMDYMQTWKYVKNSKGQVKVDIGSNHYAILLSNDPF